MVSKGIISKNPNRNRNCYGWNVHYVHTSLGFSSIFSYVPPFLMCTFILNMEKKEKRCEAAVLLFWGKCLIMNESSGYKRRQSFVWCPLIRRAGRKGGGTYWEELISEALVHWLVLRRHVLERLLVTLDFLSGQKETAVVAKQQNSLDASRFWTLVTQNGTIPCVTDGSQWWGEELSLITTQA